MIDGTVALCGSGVVTLDGSGDEITGTNCGTLENFSSIIGSGQIGAGGAALTLINECSGVINADNASDGPLVIDTGCNTVDNLGLMEATGGGTLEIEDSVNNAGGTIEASGNGSTITFGNFKITLNSAVAGGGGTIKASNGGAITFNCGTINSATWAPTSGGTIEALTCGTIGFNGTTVYNQGSSIEADGIGAMILLAGAAILGGTLETSAHGVIETVACSGNSTLDGVTITTGSTIQVNDHTTLTLQDTIDANATVTNDGTITLVQGSDPSLIINGDLTLAGSGTVVLSGDTDSIVGSGGGDTLSNANTIAGAGTIGGEGLVLSNLAGGVVDADASGHTLALDTGTTDTNLGVLEATNGGVLEIDDNVCNVGGTIAAYGCGSVVELEGVTIKGGMFLTDNSTSGDRGVIEVVSTDSDTVFDGGGSHAISIGGFVHVDAGATLKLIGTIDLAAQGNNGTIDLAQTGTGSGAIGADLAICGTVTLTGSGGITMEGGAAEITAAAPGAALHNAASIVGAGSIGVGDNDLTLVNESRGVINANNASADSLTIDTGGNTITNHGTLEASGGGTLDIVSHVDNSSGTLMATSGGVLDIESAICGGAATIHAGTLEFDAASNVNVTFDNGSVASPTYGTLVLGDPADFSGTIANFTGTSPDANHSDTIDLADFKACNTTLNATYNGDDGITTLCVVDTTDDLSATLKLIGLYSTGNFTIASDGKGGIDIFDPPTTGATDAPATATAPPSNDHATASASQNGTDNAPGTVNAAAFGGDQSSTVTSDVHNGSNATPATNELAPPTGVLAPDSGQVAGATGEAAFGSDQAAVGNSGEADAGALTNGSNGGVTTQTLLSSLLNVLTNNTSPTAGVAPNAPVLGSEHVTDSTIVDGSDAANGADTSSAPPTTPANEHAVAPASITSPPPAELSTLTSATFGASSNDSFAFHPNLGGDTAQNTPAIELAHSNVQASAPAPASIAPEFHQEFAFDAIHQDDTHLAATVDQFHQMAANSTLLH